MKLGELLDRAYDVLQDDKASPRDYLRQPLVDYVNRGCLLWRAQIEDYWFREYVPLVANQSIYDLPDECVRVQRISFDDTTMDPTTILGLQGLDEKWETTTGPEPFLWTSHGLPHNQFRVYPKPTTSSGDVYIYAIAPAGGGDTVDDGLIVQYTDSGGNATFITDPLDPGMTDPDTGITLAIDGVQFFDEDGEVMVFDASGLAQLEVWSVERPSDLTGDGDIVPVKAGYELAPLWYTLWQTYLEEGERHDSNLAGLYRGLWNDLVLRAQENRSTPLPLQVHVLGGNGRATGGHWPRFNSSMTVNGSPVTVKWSR